MGLPCSKAVKVQGIDWAVDTNGVFWLKARDQNLIWRPTTSNVGTWFKSPPLRCPCREIIINLLVKHVGRGNQDGKLWIRLIRKGYLVCEQSFPLKTHMFSNVYLRVSDSALLRKSTVGDIYEIRRYGGNKRLTVGAFQLGLVGPIFTVPTETQHFDVKIPEGVGPGYPLVVQTPDFQMLKFTVPKGTKSGELVKVIAPPAPPGPAIPPDPPMKKLSIRIPNGAQLGSTIYSHTPDGQTVKLKVCGDVIPGLIITRPVKNPAWGVAGDAQRLRYISCCRPRRRQDVVARAAASPHDNELNAEIKCVVGAEWDENYWGIRGARGPKSTESASTVAEVERDTPSDERKSERLEMHGIKLTAGEVDGGGWVGDDNKSDDDETIDREWNRWFDAGYDSEDPDEELDSLADSHHSTEAELEANFKSSTAAGAARAKDDVAIHIDEWNSDSESNGEDSDSMDGLSKFTISSDDEDSYSGIGSRSASTYSSWGVDAAKFSDDDEDDGPSAHSKADPLLDRSNRRSGFDLIDDTPLITLSKAFSLAANYTKPSSSPAQPDIEAGRSTKKRHVSSAPPKAPASQKQQQQQQQQHQQQQQEARVRNASPGGQSDGSARGRSRAELEEFMHI